jgi:hypothetical protein
LLIDYEEVSDAWMSAANLGAVAPVRKGGGGKGGGDKGGGDKGSNRGMKRLASPDAGPIGGRRLANSSSGSCGVGSSGGGSSGENRGAGGTAGGSSGGDGGGDGDGDGDLDRRAIIHIVKHCLTRE